MLGTRRGAREFGVTDSVPAARRCAVRLIFRDRRLDRTRKFTKPLLYRLSYVGAYFLMILALRERVRECSPNSRFPRSASTPPVLVGNRRDRERSGGSLRFGRGCSRLGGFPEERASEADHNGLRESSDLPRRSDSPVCPRIARAQDGLPALRAHRAAPRPTLVRDPGLSFIHSAVDRDHTIGVDGVHATRSLRVEMFGRDRICEKRSEAGAGFLLRTPACKKRAPTLLAPRR